MNLFELLLHPRLVVKKIDEKPRIMIPFIINAALYFLIVVGQWIFLQEILLDLSTVVWDRTNLALVNNYRILSAMTTWIAMILGPWIKAVIINAESKILFDESSFAKILSVIYHALFIIVLGELLYLPLRLFLKDVYFHLSLGLILKKYLSETWLIILNQLDIFMIWFQLIVIIGVKEIYNISFKQSISIVLIPVILMIGLLFFS